MRMIHFIFYTTIVLSIFFPIILQSQNIPDRLQYQDMFWTETDTFCVKGIGWDFPFTTFKSDTVDMGTDGYEGVYMDVISQNDTLRIPYVNSPFEQYLYIPVGSMRDTTILRLRFNAQFSNFTKKYIEDTRGFISFKIPEVYELANVILSLTDCSSLTFNRPENSDYANKVMKNFQIYKDHPLIKILNKKCNNDNLWDTYYSFRENSICFEFDENDQLKFTTPYKWVYFDDTEIHAGEFRNLLYLTQDFVNKSSFRKFYSENMDYYKTLEIRQKNLLRVDKMWKWLENEFPNKYNSYKIIFSPLIVGSHSTQNFYEGDFENTRYRECLMFVNSTENIDKNNKYSELEKEGLSSGIVFTEIDHNYVNPISVKNINLIKDLMQNKDFWATKDEQKNYDTEYRIFNEYMTHSLFCLYVKENFPEKEGTVIINQRLKIMDRRGYTKFSQFNDLLIGLLKNRTKKVFELYPEIISEMNKIK